MSDGRASVELIWEVACQEALAGGAGEVEPEHFFCALTKFAELPLELPVPGNVLDALVDEQKAIQRRLRESRLDGTALRRRLRALMPPGTRGRDGATLHRSDPSRRLFEEAARQAKAAGESFGARHLFEELLAHPTQRLASLLGDSTAVPEEAKTPQGVRELAPTKPTGSSVDPRAKVLAEALKAKGPALCLFCERGAEASTLLAAASGILDAQSPRLLKLDTRAMNAQDCEETLRACAASGHCTVLLELVGLPSRAVQTWMEGLPRTLPPEVSVAVALDADATAPAALGEVRVIWLHDLSPHSLPERLAPETGPFTPSLRPLLDSARHAAWLEGERELPLGTMLAAVAGHPEGRVRLAACLDVSLDRLKQAFPALPKASRTDPAPMPLSADLKSTLERAKALAWDLPDGLHPGWIALVHLVAALGISPAACARLEAKPKPESEVRDWLGRALGGEESSDGFGAFVARLRDLRRELLAQVSGQDNAVHTFVEGLFSAELIARSDESRRQPKALFAFAGPPGVGKTFLAETGAKALGRPFRRFDMSSYADHQAFQELVGFAPTYKGAQPGLLTGFVAEHPDAFLLFDEVEKAHLSTIHLFLQILDAGHLEDKNTGDSVSFRDTVIIFTTNAGASLYDRPNETGVHTANASFHRRTLLDALRTEKGPRGEPFFPAAICSRLATGYPLLFNRLGVGDLERIARGELSRVAGLVEQQHFKTVTFDEAVPLVLVLREGVRTDARTIRAQSAAFLKNELFRFTELLAKDRLGPVWAGLPEIHVGLDPGARREPLVQDVIHPDRSLRILLVAEPGLASLHAREIPGIEWISAGTGEEAAQLLATRDVDLALVDLWIGGNPALHSLSGTVAQFDVAPLSARALEEGQRCLATLRERLPLLPVYLLSLHEHEEGPGTIDETLLLACARSGGARGMISCGFLDDARPGWEDRRDAFAKALMALGDRCRREQRAESLGRESKVLAFDTVPSMDPASGRVSIRMRNFRLTQALAAEDTGGVLDAVERPRVRFEDVIGAESAKEALRFVVDWMKDPKRYAALGVNPPKGLLLTGPPGTGKTMLARALAGESDVAFLVASGTDFVTVWQGSGPQNIRDLFARARRYAPAIVFIDEIDAVGQKRSGAASGGRAEEATLNALLTELDGFSSTQRPVIVLAATNLAEHLDDALRRRFDREIEVPPPDRAAREAFLKREAGSGHSEVSDRVLASLAGRSAGLSLADLRRILNEARVMAARAGTLLTDTLLEEAFEKFRMGEPGKAPEPATLERIARHEAGHALVGWFTGSRPVQVTIVGRGGAGGYVEKESQEDRILYTRDELGILIRQAMGGRAAEIVYYGEREGQSTGVGSDLRAASRWAERMVREFGMSEAVGQLHIDERQLRDGPLAVRVTEAAEAIVRAELDQGVRLLESHRGSMDRLVTELLARNRLTARDLEALLPTPESSGAMT